MEEAWKLTERQRKEGWRYVDEGREGEGDWRGMEGGRFLREGQKDRGNGRDTRRIKPSKCVR